MESVQNMNFVTQYSDFQSYTKKGLKDKLRSGLKSMILNSGSTFYKSQLEKNLSIPRIQFIYYHHVFKDELYGLNKTLEVLSKDFKFISYLEAVERISSNNIDAPYMAFSSDDGLKNNLEASQVFEKYGASVCHFINPSIAGEKDFQKISAHCNSKLNSPAIEFLDWSDMEFLLKQGHEIGSHALSHTDLARISGHELEDEIFKSKDLIESHFGRVDHFAFPYGREQNFNLAARKLVSRAGYKSCASAIRGCHFPMANEKPNEDLILFRDHVIFDWDPKHIRFFSMNNARKGMAETLKYGES